MFLKSVTALGFKSFADRTALEFQPGITTVVGPNGSGKSNVSDAIRWVLGEQSAKDLRGSKMEDVIFSGSGKRRALGAAEVHLVFDNTDKRLPLDFDEISITRRLYRSGDSDYAINKKSCRLKDIVDLLADTGLGKGAMFVIGQNKIDEILNSRPEDRRSIFEEAAGIARFRMRKKEAGRRLNETAENLTRINDIKCEVESQVEPLRLEAEKTEKFNGFQTELRSCKLTQFVRKIETMETARAEVQKVKTGAENLLAAKNAEVGTMEAEHTRLQKELDELNNQYTHVEEGIRAKEKALEALKGEDAVLDERVKQSREQQGRAARRNEKLQVQIDEWEAQLKVLAEEYDRLDAAKTEAEEKVARLEADRAKRQESKDKGEAALRKLTDSSREDLQKLVELRNEVRSLEEEQNRRMRKRESLKSDIEELEASVAFFQQEQRDLLREKGELSQDLEKDIADGKSLAEETRQEKAKLDGVQREYNSCEKQIEAIETRLRMLHNMQESLDGFGYGIRNVMQSGEAWRQEVLGPATALLKVEAEYVTAIETALGGGAQNIVIRTAEAAKKAIAYLKAKRGGRATFLPLDTIKEPYLSAADRKLAELPGIRGFAADLADCAEDVRPALRFLIGRVLVAENMDFALAAAKEGKFRFRVVTLDGDMVNAGGSLSGGSRSKKEAGYLSRKQTIADEEKKQEELNGVLLGIQERKEVMEFAMEDREKRLEELREAVQKKNLRLTELKSEEKRVAERLQQENEKLEVSLDERNGIGQAYMETRTVLSGKRTALREMEAGDESAKAELDKLQRRIDADNSALGTLDRQLQDARVRAESSRAQRDTKSQRMQEVDGDLGRLHDDFDNNIAEQEKLERTIIESGEQKKTLAERTRVLMQELQDTVSGKDTFLAQRVELNQKQGALAEQLTALRKEQAKAEAGVHQAELDNARLESDYQNAVEQMTSEYKVSLDEAKAEGLLEEKSDTALKRQEMKLEREIEDLGPVNPAAIEQYHAVSDRYRFLQQQFDDLCEARDNLEAVISEIDSGMTRRFREAFNEINKFFHSTYVELFGGGTALLKLSDPEDILESGIDIEVQPPGKKLQSLYLLSGGERALTVIALLFALLSYHPSPFCILDEIDAPLDDANIDRFAGFLKSYAEHTQFIVITHRKGTMEAADVMYGITMEEVGVSKILSVEMHDSQRFAQEN